MEKLILYGIFSLLLFSCSNQHVNKELPVSTAIQRAHDDSLLSDSRIGNHLLERQDSLIVSRDSSKIIFWCRGKWIIGDQKPMVIKGRNWFYHSYSLPEKFYTDSVLCHFFYGRYYKIMREGAYEKDTDSFVCWKRPDYKKYLFLGRPYAEDTSIFPFNDGNETRFLDTLEWKQPDGKKYLLFSFSTSQISMDFRLGMCGHYDPGALGLALFVWNDNKWDFISFCPAVDFTGAWSSADRPEVAITGNSSFVILVSDHDFAPGGPQYNFRSLYVVDGNHFKKVSDKIHWGVDGCGRLTDWTTRIIPNNKNSNDTCPNLNLVSGGVIYVGDTDLIGVYFNIPENEKYFHQKDIFKFERTQKMIFENGKYIVTETMMKVDTTYVPYQ